MVERHLSAIHRISARPAGVSSLACERMHMQWGLLLRSEVSPLPTPGNRDRRHAHQSCRLTDRTSHATISVDFSRYSPAAGVRGAVLSLRGGESSHLNTCLPVTRRLYPSLI